MKNILFAFILGTLLLSACGAAGNKGMSVEVHDAWARTAMKDGNGAAYMLLHNHSTEDDAFVGASSDVAGAVEIHLSQMKADGTIEMIKQESVIIPADEGLELKPGSYHLMLIGLKQDLKTGDEITLTLHFKNHEDITLTAPVLEAPNMDGHMP